MSEVTLLFVGRGRSTAHVSDFPPLLWLIPSPPSHLNDMSLEGSFLSDPPSHTLIHTRARPVLNSLALQASCLVTLSASVTTF